MSVSSPEKPSKANRLSAAEEAKYRRKHRELLKRIRDVESEYDLLMLTLERSKQRVSRLRVERSLLFEKLESLYQGDLSDADLFGDYVHAPPETHKSSTDGANGSLQPSCGVGERSSPAPAAVGGKSGKGRARQPPDPNAPKRPANAFMVFCSMMRKEEHKKAPDTLSQSDTTKLLAQRWNGMSREEQRQFYDLYEKDKERYAQEMSAYQAAGGATALAQNEELGAVETAVAVPDAETTTIAADEKVHEQQRRVLSESEPPPVGEFQEEQENIRVTEELGQIVENTGATEWAPPLSPAAHDDDTAMDDYYEERKQFVE